MSHTFRTVRIGLGISANDVRHGRPPGSRKNDLGSSNRDRTPGPEIYARRVDDPALRRIHGRWQALRARRSFHRDCFARASAGLQRRLGFRCVVQGRADLPALVGIDVGAECELVFLAIGEAEQQDRIDQRFATTPHCNLSDDAIRPRRVPAIFQPPGEEELSGDTMDRLRRDSKVGGPGLLHGGQRHWTDVERLVNGPDGFSFVSLLGHAGPEVRRMIDDEQATGPTVKTERPQ